MRNSFSTRPLPARANSGGPIVAQDGRVIGLVTAELPTPSSTHHRLPGVPAGQIRKALRDLGVDHLIQWEDWHF